RVQGGPDVVAHATVDGDVDAGLVALDVDHLDRADLVDRDAGGSADGPAGFDGELGTLQPQRTALVGDQFLERGGQVSRRHRGVGGDVGDTEATTEVE